MHWIMKCVTLKKINNVGRLYYTAVVIKIIPYWYTGRQIAQ